MSVTLCGPSRSLNAIRASDIRLTVSSVQAATGLQTAMARVSTLNSKDVWAIYSNDLNGIEVLVSVEGD